MHQLTLSDVLADHARSHPQSTAAVDGAVRLSYPELDLRVNRLANAMTARGIGRGDRVVWLGQNSFRVLELLLAASRIGAICCPVNWRQSADELRFVLEDLTPSLVVYEDGVTPGDGWIESGDAYEAFLGAPDPVEGPGDDGLPVLALYTAAFDGRPNAALLSSAALVAHASSLLHVRRMEPEFVFLNNGPLFHVGTMMFTLATLLVGGTNVFIPAFDAIEVCRVVDAEKVTQAFLFGQMIDAVAAANASGKYDLKSLHFVSHSPEWDAMTTVDDSPWCRTKMGGYGQTEVGGMLTFLGLAAGGAGFAGRPSPLVQARLLDAELREVPPGEVGEICARGKSLFSGYFNRPELNAYKSRGGWHHTGDLGRREPDGTLTFIGPSLRMIKSGNENIYPAEVERALKTHPAVADAAVIGVPDERWHQAVRAIVALRPDSTATPAELIDHVRDQLASYKKPRDVVVVESIPKKGFTPDYDALDSAHGGGNYPGQS
ncbi:long-chain acyl-CoA synthetase [Acrocarpospora corrugata]|uniref:Long-chain acyl-CoA synthetase n=1 Tax=Acrocarpospora corrugata TaxID=35763 RepID=A0A5M3W9L1_9ACTN|nr:AMP-binding protein [Acrocarpospora corrugata]GES05755.1 long-chain acyl-CoA synthetase [Acrocarpospora corrugata]